MYLAQAEIFSKLHVSRMDVQHLQANIEIRRLERDLLVRLRMDEELDARLVDFTVISGNARDDDGGIFQRIDQLDDSSGDGSLLLPVKLADREKSSVYENEIES